MDTVPRLRRYYQGAKTTCIPSLRLMDSPAGYHLCSLSCRGSLSRSRRPQTCRRAGASYRCPSTVLSRWRMQVLPGFPAVHPVALRRFATHCVRYTTCVAACHATLAPGWWAAPLPGRSRTCWTAVNGFRYVITSSIPGLCLAQYTPGGRYLPSACPARRIRPDSGGSTYPPTATEPVLK